MHSFKKFEYIRKNMDSYALELNNITKSYKDLKAVNNLNLKIKKGELFGFLGPNGAGKTTTIKSIIGLIYPDSGFVKINGKDVFNNQKEIKKNIGYLPEKVSFYNKLTALQNLKFYAELKKVPKGRCLELIKEFGLYEFANKKVGQYSKGMIQRLGIARAMLGNPSILFLDEPTSGLDPRAVKWIRNKIKKLNEDGVTIFISSHILSEIQETCTQVGIINKGNLVAQDSVDKLSTKLQMKPKMVLNFRKITEKVKNIAKNISRVERIEISGNNLTIYCDFQYRSKVIYELEKNNIDIKNIETEKSSLEDIFMKYTEGQ